MIGEALIFNRMLTELDLSCDEMKRTEAKMKIKMID